LASQLEKLKLAAPTSHAPITAYECPSSKSLKFSINDFSITDIIRRHELTLPEINKNKLVEDPLLGFQIEKQLPVRNISSSSPMHCLQLNNERAWRRRKMNIKKKKKYEKKQFFVIQKRNQNREKRFTNIMAVYKSIEEKKVHVFEPLKYIDRELEKARHFGFRCSPVYDSYRQIVRQKMPTFDSKYTRTFDNPLLPIHIKLNMDLSRFKIKTKKKTESPGAPKTARK
jgi:hypothetical protein